MFSVRSWPLHLQATIGLFIVAGEWWKSDTEAVINQALKSGLAPNVSDAHTINGRPGPMSTCASSSQGNLHFFLFLGNMARKIMPSSIKRTGFWSKIKAFSMSFFALILNFF